MITTPAQTTGRAGGARSLGRGTLVLRLLPLGVAAMVAVDAVLGESAEYFNATKLLQAWGSVARGHGLGGNTFVFGQEQMSDAAALAAGSALFVLEPALVLAALVYGGSAVARLVRARSAR